MHLEALRRRYLQAGVFSLSWPKLETSGARSPRTSGCARSGPSLAALQATRSQTVFFDAYRLVLNFVVARANCR